MQSFSSISNQYKDQKSISSSYAQKRETPFFKSIIQPKLTINPPTDIYEQEADAMAEKVMSPSSNSNSFFSPSPVVISDVQRKCQHCEEEEKMMHRKENSSEKLSSNASLDDYVSKLETSGSTIDPTSRNFFESRFGYDFSNVKIHNDNDAATSAKSINALAYTTGQHIVFGSNQYQPETSEGKKLLAHELTHVVQQKNFTGIQRDKAKIPPVANGDQAILNFKDDWKNYFSYYDKFVTIGAVTFDKNQQEKIKAVKNGKNIDITVNGDFDTVQDEHTHLPWIKAAIVDHFAASADKFEDMAYDPTHSKIHGINPLSAIGSYCNQNCPATAAALEQYLKTGTVSKAVCDPTMEGVPGYGFDISQDSFEPSVSEKDAEKKIRGKLKKHGDFVIIEGTRSDAQLKAEPITKNHYFAVVNIHGKLFAIDAFGEGIVDDDVDHYLKNRVGKNATYRIAKGSFIARPVIPKP